MACPASSALAIRPDLVGLAVHQTQYYRLTNTTGNLLFQLILSISRHVREIRITFADYLAVVL